MGSNQAKVVLLRIAIVALKRSNPGHYGYSQESNVKKISNF